MRDGGRRATQRIETLRDRSKTAQIGFPQQVLEIEPVREHRDLALLIARPIRFSTVAVELDSVAVGIAQVERFADAVVCGSIKLDSCGDHAAQRIGKRRARRVEDCGVIQTGGGPPALSQVLRPI
jgi:hypothetical protein